MPKMTEQPDSPNTTPKPEPLPPGWAWTTLGEVGHYINGRAFKSSDWGDTGRPILRIQNLTGSGSTLNRYDGEVEEKHIVRSGDLLISWAATLGAYIYRGEEAALNQHIFKVEPFIDRQFLYYGVLHYIRSLKAQARGSGMQHITKGDFEASALPLPPLPEQQRIVSRIEELFSKLDAGVEGLKRTQALLKRYRQSLLHAAVTGELSREWRAQNPATETGAELLERILKERREKWATSGKKGTYKEPQGPNTEGLAELPEGWAWASVEQIADDRKYALAIGPFGSNLKVSDYTDSGVPLVFVRNIRSQTFGVLDNKAKFISPAKADELAAHTVRSGEVLVTKMGDPPGDACLYPRNQPDAVITSDCIKVTVQEKAIIPIFVVMTINSLLGRNQIATITQGVAQLKVSLERFKGFAVPLAPLTEQAFIVSDVERRLSVLDNMEATVAAELKRAEAMRQSILHQAFSGKLVAQDPNDEPASTLLERIQAEKVQAGAKAIRAGTGRRGRKPSTKAAAVLLSLDE